jgi:hypothetical protein
MSPTHIEDNSKGLSVCLLLIHNNNAERNQVIKHGIISLANHIQQLYKTKIIEISYQPELRDHGTLLAFAGDLLYQYLGYKWAKYRLLPPSFSRTLCETLKHVFKRYVLDKNQSLTRWRRSSSIEVTVTDKHIRGWDAFLESGEEVLIVFEDDAIFNQNSIDRIYDMLTNCFTYYLDQNLYIDLAGGCALSDLGIHKLALSKSGGWTAYQKPVTNTACSYLLNRTIAQNFRRELTKNPTLRLIGIDWMMNALFMKLFRSEYGEDNRFTCFHSDPPVFTHGSVTRHFEAWAR